MAGRPPQQCLKRWPLPQGHGAFRDTAAVEVDANAFLPMPGCMQSIPRGAAAAPIVSTRKSEHDRAMDELGPLRGRFAASSAALWQMSGVLAVVLLPMTIKRVLSMQSPEAWQVVAAFAALLLVPVLVFALCLPLLRLYRVSVYEQGVRGYDAWGRFRRVRWSAMSGAELLHFPGFTWVKVATREIGVTLTIPEFLAQQQEFERLVTGLAGPANPLTRYYAARKSPH
jgi:hypothetical protein